jgi:hypothetical protein
MDRYSAAAHKWTDAEIAKLERELKQLYSQSYAEIKKKSEAILSKINTTPYDRGATVRRVQKIQTLAIVRGASGGYIARYKRRSRADNKRQNGRRVFD